MARRLPSTNYTGTVDMYGYVQSKMGMIWQIMYLTRQVMMLQEHFVLTTARVILCLYVDCTGNIFIEVP